MLSGRGLYVAFVLNVALMIFLGVYAYTQFVSFRDATDTIYKHPFTVSNAVQSIRTHVVSMHAKMRDVVLTEHIHERESIISSVRLEEDLVVSKFNIVFDRYLGEKTDVNEAYDKFQEWLQIRDEILELASGGENNLANRMIKARSAQHIIELDILIDKLAEFAAQMANDVHQRTIEEHQHSLKLLSVFTVLVLLGVVTTCIIFSNQKKLQISLNQHLHLIDQHILIVSLDKEARIIEITNALCLLIGVRRLDVVQKPFHELLVSFNMSERECSEMVEAVLAGDDIEVERYKVNELGEKNWIRMSAHPVYNDSFLVCGIKIFFDDISLEKENAELANTDQLTSLLNRRSFFPLLDKQLRIAKRNGHVFELALLDLDYFKNYNDQYGHPQGDEILVKVANCMRDTFQRADDYLLRLGGEEFGVIYALSDDSARQGDRAEVLRAMIEAMEIAHSQSEVSDRVTVSIGVVRYLQLNTISADQVYRLADQALYEAKEHRNFVVYREVDAKQ